MTWKSWVCCLGLMLVIASLGCSRQQYRQDADRQAYELIAERNVDPSWSPKGYGIEMDPRSRYFESENAECPPMPQDDPLSSEYMRMVAGRQGWPYWLDNGVRQELENPGWRERLGDYVAISPEGAIQLDLETALKLAYIHSTDNQSQLETLFLSALDVSAERFRLDTQLFSGYDLSYNHSGPLIPASLSFDSSANQWVINPPFDGTESNRLTVGRGSGGNPAFQTQRRFATAGQLVTGFANSFVFEFAGGDGNLTSSLANFAFMQPLLAGAGRDVALEQLTFDERALLSNMRAYAQFRQGFYTQIAVGETGVSGPQRGGAGTSVQVFPGLGGVGGYTGLLQQVQEIQNSVDNLDLQLRSLRQLEALLKAGLIDLVQVDQFRQNVERERASLLRLRNNLERSIDVFLTQTLGLPPDLNVQLDDTLIQQFQFVPRESKVIEGVINSIRDRAGAPFDSELTKLELEKAEFERIKLLLPEAEKTVAKIFERLEAAKASLAQMDKIVPGRLPSMSEKGVKDLREARIQLNTTMTELYKSFNTQKDTPKKIRAGLNPMTRKQSTTDLIVWLSAMLRLTERAVLVQARARLESVVIESIELSPEDAFGIALDNRLDFKNARASLVDSWRLIQVRADALQSVLNFNASGDVRTSQNNPLSFRAATSAVRVGVEFDAPLTRLLERNAYREALVSYQRNRRNLIQSGDRLHLGLRSQLREIRRLRQDLEIQRTSVAIAIRQLDSTRARLYAPVPPPQPGQRAAQFGPTSAFNLLQSLRSLRDSQNSFLRVWLSYYAARMRLLRELGIMKLDAEGDWMVEAPPTGRLQPAPDPNGPIPDGMGGFLPPLPEMVGPPPPMNRQGADAQRLPPIGRRPHQSTIPQQPPQNVLPQPARGDRTLPGGQRVRPSEVEKSWLIPPVLEQ